MKKMSFLSLYRKYRPENFNDLIGQDHVVQTLKNALKNDRVAHAYLFAGPRGTGKTSTAKVFAKALNCSKPGADFEPCGECSSCQRIDNGSSLDVIEIDAASNRGIDEIRELREKVKFYPGEGKYKVYIIDEVHMLTKGAFNALLKTLEEPPDSVVFILATTEPHKVITTIMSRCQRFDFSLLTLSDIKMRLQYIVNKEGYEIAPESLDILARSARGGMRDGISLLDQAISFSDGSLDSEEIGRMLGRINKDQLKEFLVYLSKKKSQKALKLLDEQLESGLGIERFSDELISYCRELLLIKECGINSGILEYSQNYLDELAETASQLSTAKITDIIDEFASLKQKLRSSARPRLQLEISVIKLSSKEKSNSLEARLSELEYKLNSILAEHSSKKSAAADTALDFNEGAAQAEIAKSQDSRDEKRKKSFDKKSYKKDGRSHPGAGNESAQKKSGADNFSAESEKKAAKNEKKEKQRQDSNQANEQKSKPEPTSEEVSSTAEMSADQQSSAPSDLSIKKVKNYWAKALNQIRQIDISVQALLREGEPTAVEGKKIIISFAEGKKFHYKGAQSNKALITKVLRNILNEAVELEFIYGEYKKKSQNDNLADSKQLRQQEEAEADRDEVLHTEYNKNSAARKNDLQEKSNKINNRDENNSSKTEPELNNDSKEASAREDKDFKNKNRDSGKKDSITAEEIAGIFSGEIIEVDKSILENRGGS